MGGRSPRDPYWEDLKIVIVGILTLSLGTLGAGSLSLLESPFWIITMVAGLALIVFGLSEMIRDWRNPPESLDEALVAEDEASAGRGVKTRTIVVVKIKCRRCGVLNSPDAKLCSECRAEL